MLQEEQRVELRQVPDDALAGQDADENDEDGFQIGGAGEGFAQRRFGDAAFVADLLEQWRFIELQADPQRDHQQHSGQQERHAPAPVREGALAGYVLHNNNDAQRKDQPDGRRKLNPACRCAAFARLRMLGDVDCGAAIFAADGEALQHAQAHQQPWRGQPDRVRIGKKTRDECGKAHQGDRDEEGALAARAIAEAAEEYGAKGTREETGGEGQQCEDVALCFTGAGEEMLGDDRRDGAVDEEVVPFKYGACG